jgi:hypothetical protein
MAAAEKLVREKKPLSVDALIRQGVPDKAVQRTIIIDFGNDGSVFEALVPESYLINGQVKPLRELGPGHL